jgi:outer membrane receptor protein involved in Fe transport
MVSQHAGGGKSDQYFIRGFDADHGTDIAIYADGVPVNMPSHGHGQGYADTHFLIPETISTVDVHKGPYSARFGDFYTAGAMELQTIDHVDGPTLWIAGGAPLAGPKIMGQGGVTLVHGPAFASLRARGIGDRPGNDSGTLTARGYLIFDLIAGRTFGKLDVNLTVNNLFNSDWREAQFADTSAVTPGGPAVEQMHFTPGIPLTATATAAYRL